MTILSKVKNTIKAHGLLEINDKVLLGVSGGPDSVAMLYLLNRLKKEFALSLHIAHLDHRLRKDSRKDREFVEGLASSLRLPITVSEILPGELSGHGSLEEAARKARLDFFFRVARNIKATKIALAHNLDDQAETVLMRIIRGTGLYGLSGILPKRKIYGHWIIRPLVEIKRSEINAFLKRKGISPRIDDSNAEDIYFRNRVRNRLLPLLEKEYNKNIKVLLSNMAESVGQDYDYLSRAVSRRLKNASKKRLKLEMLKKMHPAIQRMVIRSCIRGLQGDTRRLTFTHIREIDDLINSRPIGSIVDLPKGISVTKTKNFLSFYLRKS